MDIVDKDVEVIKNELKKVDDELKKTENKLKQHRNIESPYTICNYEDLTNLEYIKKYPYIQDPYWIIKYYGCDREIRLTADELVSMVKFKKALVVGGMTIFPWTGIQMDFNHFVHKINTECEVQGIYDEWCDGEMQCELIYNRILDLSKTEDRNEIETHVYFCEPGVMMLSSKLMRSVVESLFPAMTMRKLKEVMINYLVIRKDLNKKVRIIDKHSGINKMLNVWYVKFFRSVK